MNYPEVEISKRGAAQIKSGSLWIFANEFVTKMKDLKPGAWVNFQSAKEFVGFGYVNPHSLIAGRVCSLKPIENRQTLFENLFSEALKKREGFSDSYRAVFAESDGLPGLIIDVYEKSACEKTAVVQITTLGMDEAIEDVTHGLKKLLNPTSIVIRADSQIRQLEGAKTYSKVILGDENELRSGVVREDHTLIAANFVEGQKTGFFLDQRENRKHLKKMAQGKRILDLCSYSGGWGLSALKGGAKEVVFVDQSKEALDLVKKGLILNEIPEEKAKLVTADVFDYLESSRDTFDIVICDPPAFVKSKKTLPQAIKAYKKLNSLALKKISSRGILYSCSCSFHLSEEEFENILRDEFQKAGRIAQVIYKGLQPLDHPWVLNRPESRYLKCFCLRVD